MAMLDWISPDPGLVLEGERVRLRAPRMADHQAWAKLRQESYEFLQPWEPTWPEDDLTRAAYRRRLSLYARDIDLGYGYPFFVLRREDGALLGGVNLRDVKRGVSQSAAIGYWAGQRHARRGYTLEAVRLVLDFAFEHLNLHRIEAACCPDNEASRQLLHKAGFEAEGCARGYLKINGVWRDHLLFGKIRSSGG